MPDELTTIDAAREAVLERTDRTGTERVPLVDCPGRVLAQAVVASEQVPGFDNSAMDGFAVRAVDVAGAPTELEVADEARAGHPAEHGVHAREAVAISTGAPMPAGADAVVRVEDSDPVGPFSHRVRIKVGVEAGVNVRRAGDDIESGDRLLDPGDVLDAAAAGVLASVGIRSVECFRRPRVKVLCTGDELIGVDGEPFPGSVRNSNAHTIPALARAAGADASVIERVGDQAEATVAAIREGLDADLLAICGGVSVGRHDHVKDALAELGVEKVFWGVSLKPGKPLYFGSGPGGHVLGLPGNPVSAFVTFLLFARPALRVMQGSDPGIDRVGARLAEAYEKPGDRAHAVRCRLELDERGWTAHPAPRQGSHVLTSMVGIDGLAIVPAEVERVAAGETVEVELVKAW
ncbi:MAG: molybdopterin molybdotransferase MoeA [Solirubrobacterales bacterium]